MSSPAATPLPTTLGLSIPRIVIPAGGFLAGFLPVAVLGFENGGYDVGVVAGAGVVLWWLLLVGIATGAIPRPTPTRIGMIALGAVVLLAAWAALSIGWSASEERGLTELVRLVVFGGALLLGLSATAGGQGRAVVGGVLAGLALLSGAGVLSRLQPDLFPGAGSIIAELGTGRRLSWPMNYWNGLGAAAALALPLGITVAVRARTAMTSGLAAATVPITAVCLLLTLSRGATAAAVLGLLVALATLAPRLVTLRTMLAPAAGTAALIAATLGDDALREAVGGAAQSDAGRRLLPLFVLVSVGVALVQAGSHVADEARWTPHVPRPSRNVGLVAAGAVVLVLLVTALAADAPGRVGDGIDSFKDPDRSALGAKGGSVRRLGDLNGSGRYEEWSTAVTAIRENPLGGIGLGSWDSWFSPRRVTSPPVRNAHSQPLEIGAETGIGGMALFLVIVLAPIAGGAVLLRRRRRRTPHALVVLPTMCAFVVCISVDWAWQLSAIPVAIALLAGTLLGRDATVPAPVTTGAVSDAPPAPPRSRTSSRRVGRVLAPVGGSVIAVVCLAVLAVAMIAPRGVDESQSAQASGAAQRAIAEAAKTEQAAPFSLAAVTQRALAAEEAGDLTTAVLAARQATEVEPRNWRPWMVLARIEAARNHATAAVRAYRRAKALNPRSPLLNP